MHTSLTFKGQIISECLLEKIVSTKIPTKNLIDSAQKSLYRQGKYLCWPESYIIYEVPVAYLARVLRVL